MENYADRSGAAFVGRYAQRVADQFHMKYVSPQESGTRSGLRWWRLTDDSAWAVEICSDRHFSASAIPFAIPQLDNGSPEYVRHPGDLSPTAARTSISRASSPDWGASTAGDGSPSRIPAALRRLLVQLPAAARRRRTIADGQPTKSRNLFRLRLLRLITNKSQSINPGPANTPPLLFLPFRFKICFVKTVIFHRNYIVF